MTIKVIMATLPEPHTLLDKFKLWRKWMYPRAYGSQANGLKLAYHEGYRQAMVDLQRAFHTAQKDLDHAALQIYGLEKPR